MQWRDGPVVLLTILVVASGLAGGVLAGPAAGTGPGTAAVGAADARPVSPAHEAPGAVPRADGATGALGTADAAAAANHTPADPDTDVIGWEAGYWHNETIAVDQSDGLNDTELNATLARAMARVEVIRQLEFNRTVPVEIVSREAFQRRQENRTTSPTLRTFDNAKFEALFLVPETADSIDVQNQNRGSNVLGLYNTQTKTMELISGQETTLQLNELTLAHELVHALQDQHFNLSRYDARTRDGANAQNGLIEGDASLVEHRYEQRCDGGDWDGTCLQPDDSGSGGGSLANVGTYLLKFQPYSEGPPFVGSLEDEGGWAAVNAAYDQPPASAEQVIHAEKYLEDAPTDVSLEDRQTDTWERVRPSDRPDYGSVGEAAVFVMFWYPGYASQRETEVIPYETLLNLEGGEISSFQPYSYDHRYSAGWDGDRLHVYRNEANETAYVWRLVWDSPADASEFLEGYRGVIEYWGAEELRPDLWVIRDGGFADAFFVTVEDDTVTIVNAPSVDQLTAVRQGLQVPTPTDSPTPVTERTVTVESDTATPAPPITTTTSPGQPGFGALAALAALLVAVLWRRRH